MEKYVTFDSMAGNVEPRLLGQTVWELALADWPNTRSDISEFLHRNKIQLTQTLYDDSKETNIQVDGTLQLAATELFSVLSFTQKILESIIIFAYPSPLPKYNPAVNGYHKFNKFLYEKSLIEEPSDMAKILDLTPTRTDWVNTFPNVRKWKMRSGREIEVQLIDGRDSVVMITLTKRNT